MKTLKRRPSRLPKHKDIIPEVSFDKLIGHQRGDYFLSVVGDSMTGDGIYNDDVVLMRPKAKVPNGAIAVVMLHDGRRSIKRVFYEKDHLRLKSSNPAYDDIVVPTSEVKSVALLKGLARQLDRSVSRKPLVKRFKPK